MNTFLSYLVVTLYGKSLVVEAFLFTSHFSIIIFLRADACNKSPFETSVLTNFVNVSNELVFKSANLKNDLD